MVKQIMDPLSDLLRSVRLTGGVFLDARFTAPWCVTASVTSEDVSSFMEAPAQLIGYHVVTEGRLLLTVDGDSAIEVCAGQVILLPRNDEHTLASAAGLDPISADQLIQPPSESGLAHIIHGGGGEPTHMICGFLGSEEGVNPLIATLPRVLTLDIRQGMSREWIETSVRFAASELAAGRLASSGVMSRLSELLLVEAVRQYSSKDTNENVGWLKGLKDPYIGRALTLIHQNIGLAWSAGSLASAVALSRSAFTDRFATLVGMPPIRYLTTLRMESAKLQLRETKKTVAQLAHSVGYKSEEAFSRAFKREFGLSPTRLRGQ